MYVTESDVDSFDAEEECRDSEHETGDGEDGETGDEQDDEAGDKEYQESDNEPGDQSYVLVGPVSRHKRIPTTNMDRGPRCRWRKQCSQGGAKRVPDQRAS